MNFIERIIGTITSPDKAMADVCKEPRWEEALVIVGIYAVVFALFSYLSTAHIHMVYETEVPGMATITAVMTILVGLLTPLIYWVIITVILFLIAMAFGGDGKFTTLLTGIGFSELVKIIAVVLAIILMTQAPYITVQISQSNPLGSLSQMGDYNKNIFVIASQIVMLLGLIWSCIIGVFALKNCQKLSLKSAALVVGIPAVLYIVIAYSTMILMMLK